MWARTACASYTALAEQTMGNNRGGTEKDARCDARMFFVREKIRKNDGYIFENF